MTASAIADLYSRSDATGLADLVRRRELSSRELVEEAIRRIEAGNPRLNAVTLKCYDSARAAADAIDAGRTPADGPFRGVPFLVKDLCSNIAGLPTSGGSAMLRDIPMAADTTMVERWRAAGLVIVGRTNTPELGLMPVTEPRLFGPTHNPWDLSRTPGGSSGGSAAAVAARFVPIASGNDGGGSIRIPASCCGLVGLKPSRGRTPIADRTGDRRSVRRRGDLGGSVQPDRGLWRPGHGLVGAVGHRHRAVGHHRQALRPAGAQADGRRPPHRGHLVRNRPVLHRHEPSDRRGGR